MDFFTHMMIGILLYKSISHSLSFDYVIFIALMAVFPDLDVFLGVFKRIKSSVFLSHKGVSHTYFAALLVSIPTGIIFSLITKSPLYIAILYAFIFYSLHVTLDGLAASKMMVFYPFSKKRHRLFLDRAINPFLLIVSPIFFASDIVYLFTLNALYFLVITYIQLTFYGIYFGIKVFVKVFVYLQLSPTQQYLPGIFPFWYYIYERTAAVGKHTFTLIKKSIFSKKNDIVISASIPKNSRDELLLLKTIDYSQRYAFFSKWEYMIPMVKEEDSVINFYLFLAESYSRGRAYHIEIQFNKNTQEIINAEEGFDLKLLKLS